MMSAFTKVKTPMDLLSSLNLPSEFLDNLNQAYFLHLLATDPAQVVLPGKSILSMLSHPYMDPQSDEDKRKQSTAALHKRVENMVHKAFWEAALESLSDPLPSTQIGRLKFLYDDIRNGITFTFPSSHPILRKLSLPIAPTSSPLLSAVNDLREVLVELKTRCAPARDVLINDILHRLDDSQTPLPKMIVDASKSILEVAAIMKEDLSQFVLGSMTDGQIKDIITQQARESERMIVMTLWRVSGVKDSCRVWLRGLDLSEVDPNKVDACDHWLLRLVQVLSSTSPISCALPPYSASATPAFPLDPEPSHNPLPPPFLFTDPVLFYIQNLLQALVIAASIRSIVRPPSTMSRVSDMQITATDFMQRIWTLLKLEIAQDFSGAGGSSNADSSSETITDSSSTKLVNLADEVVRARRSALVHTGNNVAPKDNSLSAEEETRLRAAVDRTLRTQDPVFILLQKRLMSAIRDKLLLRALDSRNKTLGDLNRGRETATVPEYLRTGRDAWSNARSRDTSATPSETGIGANSSASETNSTLVVKGFEDPVLVAGIREVWGRITQSVDWVHGVWADIVEGASEANTG